MNKTGDDEFGRRISRGSINRRSRRDTEELSPEVALALSESTAKKDEVHQSLLLLHRSCYWFLRVSAAVLLFNGVSDIINSI